ncbi:hypothetical protein [Flavobacterium psychrotrophum]|uniref:hypothetical protein n=1 Tax=Flavobacterium psychrotrophum TaxID=2294119 RepID=UPI000E31A8A5|nr:hypothetical protein [Flavobacterium psychrotrophum]
MGKLKVSAQGERAAIGGYLPQFDEFSRQVYRNLVNDNLEWIRVADPEAEKLDDIQFSTPSEIHAYQVKWTISEAVITYSSFMALFPKIVASWKKIKNKNRNKKVIPHLLTNKTVSVNDKIILADGKTASFGSFMDQGWLGIKSGQTVDKNWATISKELQTVAKLSNKDFREFMSSFVFIHSYKPKPIAVASVQYSKEQEDLQVLSRFIIEKAASKDRIVEFSRQEILHELSWADRFRTTFNHDFIIDLKTYQPITSTISNLDRLISTKEGGYVYLEGGPGTGKSTMLTQWARNSNHRIIKYYAFDFTNPASGMNYQERGSSVSLFFDLVLQIKGKTRSTINVLPYKDIEYLRKTFFEQLTALGEDFKKSGTKTILIIDGLDHIPREYKTFNTFLRDLPLPQAMPSGVYIILGSQSYALEDLSVEICQEYKTTESTVKMDALTKNEVYRYLLCSTLTPPLGTKEKLQVYESSQGHPLYLSYFVEKLRSVADRASALNSFEKIDGNIDLYYLRLWKPIQNSLDLVKLLGLIARVNGPVHPKFMSEWGFTNKVLLELRDRAKFLFDVGKEWSFFHNSFRQFLLQHTCLDILTEAYNPSIDESYHADLAKFYKDSKVEPDWKKNFHLYKSGNFEAFLNEANPELFNEQVCGFRPLHEIRSEGKLGVDIALKTGNPVTLLRYFFALSEIEQKSRNIAPASWTERFVEIGKPEIAKRYLRSENKLLCSESTALGAAVVFARSGDLNEGLLLFNIAYPESISARSIAINGTHRGEDSIALVKQWIYTGAFFLDVKDIVTRINNIKYTEKKAYRQLSISAVRLELLGSLASAYISKNDWQNFNTLLKQYRVGQLKQLNAYYYVLTEAVDHCVDQSELDLARHYLSLLLEHFDRESSSDFAKIEIANLIYKCFWDKRRVGEWIQNIPQQSNVGESDLGYDGTLVPFRPLILHNKLMHLVGNGVSITEAIPNAKSGTDEELIVEYERMLCLMAKLLAEGQSEVQESATILPRVIPIVTFFYKKNNHRNRYSNKIFATKKAYYSLLIAAVSALGQKYVNDLGSYLINEYQSNPKFWPVSLRRSVLVDLLKNGFDPESVAKEIDYLEATMLLGSDISARIEECEAQSDAYHALQNNEKALALLSRAWKESIGVAYSKDYQFTSWLDWVDKINVLQPEKAPTRLSWFLSHLDHIKETTEGGTFSEAVERLLEATFDYDLESGYQQMQWLLDKGDVDFDRALGTFLKECLKRCLQPKEYEFIMSVYAEIYLLFSEGKDVALLETLLSTGVKIDSDSFLKRHLDTLITAVEVTAIEEHRGHLRNIIFDFCRAHNLEIYGTKTDLSGEDSFKAIYSERNELVLEPYKTLSEAEVIVSTSDYESLKRLVMGESMANSYFDWNSVLAKFSSMLTLENIRELGDAGVTTRKRSDYYASLSAIALGQGDRELSLELAGKSLEHSTGSGWIQHYDGGSRLLALRALSNLDQELAYKKAFELFCYDISDTNYPSMYLTDLDKILPVISKDNKVEDYWQEIESYLNRLMQNSLPLDNLPCIGRHETNIYQVLSEFLLTLTESPIMSLSEVATRTFSFSIASGNPYAVEKLEAMQDDLKASAICMYLYRIHPKALEHFTVQLAGWANNAHHTVRANARFLLKALQSPYSLEYGKLLPASYTFHLPGNPDFAVDIFKPLLRLISYEAQIDMANLEQRLSHFAHIHGTPEKWTPVYEERVRKNLDATGMKYPFRKHKITDIRNSLMYIVAELEDCEVLDMDEFARYFIFFDYAVPFYPVVAKPSIIPVIKQEGQISIRTGWVAKIDNTPRLEAGILPYGDQVVIGECYTISNLDWGRPTEEYSAGLSCFSELLDGDKIFGSLFHRLSDDYHVLGNPGPEIIVKRDHGFVQFNERSNFIAINPGLARMLSWVPSSEGLFEWMDTAGNIMVKSVFWSSGNSEMRPRHDSEIGEGWIVTASNEALLQIASVTSGLYYHKMVERFQGDGEEYESSTRTQVVGFDIDGMGTESP